MNDKRQCARRYDLNNVRFVPFTDPSKRDYNSHLCTNHFREIVEKGKIHCNLCHDSIFTVLNVRFTFYGSESVLN